MYSFTTDRDIGQKAVLRIHGIKKKRAVYITESKDPTNELGKFIETDGKFSQLPSVDSRDVLYIAGPSGSGKSTYLCSYMKNFSDIFPEAKIYLFSRIADEKSYSGCIRIVLDEIYIQSPLKTDDFPDGSLLIFDDIDTIQDKKLLAAVLKTRADILEIGRHKNLYTAVTSHLLTDGQKTREVINEATSITFFPQACNAATIRDYLVRKQGFGTKMANKLLSIEARWVTIHMRFPRYWFTEKAASMLN